VYNGDLEWEPKKQEKDEEKLEEKSGACVPKSVIVKTNGTSFGNITVWAD
jgi:hypothetical protein